MPTRLFRNRREAGRLLASELERYRGRPDAIVLALPRGGVPVGYEIATALGVPLDIFVVRKLGVPRREELAMGAIASGGVLVPNTDVVRALKISDEVLARVGEQEARELQRREEAYRGSRPKPRLAGKTVIVVDDGLATGASMRAAVRALQKTHAARIVVAVPVAPPQTCRELAQEVDEVVCGMTPSNFYAVGQYYSDFGQTTDEEVRSLLTSAWNSAPAAASGEHQEIRSQLVSAHSARELPFPDIPDVHFVLLGEASHGTHEFYEERARVTRWLIEDAGFHAVAVEADWPDAYRVNRYVRGRGTDADAEKSLGGFQRFPTWMWRNAVTLDFVRWLRAHNDRMPEPNKTGFYGLDLYSLYTSMHEVVAYLERVDPEAAGRARERYACFDHYGEDPQNYGYGLAFGAGETCEREVIDQLLELHRNAFAYEIRDGMSAEDEHFYAEQNARTVAAAEEYYRTTVLGHVVSWNLRDRHMTDTLDGLADHLSRELGEPAKIVVWAHNSHLGDARSTELAMRGELNVGQLVRERHPNDCYSIGFTTFEGTVTAASSWHGTAECMQVRPALPGSFERQFHELGEEAFLLDLHTGPAAEALRATRLERAIGVIYRPDTERQSHYIRARLADQFDAVIHIDRTRAVEPLERSAGWDSGEPPETFPFAV